MPICSINNNNDGTPSGGINQNYIGVIDGCDDLDGNNDHITVNDLDQTGDFTVEIWMNPDTLSGSQDRSVIMKNQDYGFEIDHNSETLYARVSASSWTGTNVDISVDNWQYVVMVWNETNNDLFIYVNGSLESSSLNIGNHITNDNLLYLGSYSGVDQYFDGSIEETRISSVARSSGWIKTSYNSGNNNLTSFGFEETNNAPIVTNPVPADKADDVSIMLSELIFDISDSQGDLMNYTVVTTPDIGNGDGYDKVNGTYNISLSGLNYHTIYIWYLNVTDCTSWTNRTFSFTTVS